MRKKIVGQIVVESFILFVTVGFFIFPSVLYAMQSTNYKIERDSINTGGIEDATSTSYNLRDTLGEVGTGVLEGSSTSIKSGYRQVAEDCDYDGICGTNETEMNCPSDCGCDYDSICEVFRGENADNCNDCFAGAVEIDVASLNIYDLVVIPSEESVKISWKTNEETRGEVPWGRSPSYEEGEIKENVYAYSHTVFINGLIPETIYHFRVEAEDRSGNLNVSRNQIFKTLSLPDEISPANPIDFEAEEDDEEIELSWENPPDPDFEKVKIVKNRLFYPQDPEDGEIVYEGDAEEFVDKDVLDEDYYYTIFSYDKNGNYSSGSTLKAKPKKAPPAQPKPPIIPPVKPPITPIDISELGMEDVIFIQDGRVIDKKDGRIVADAAKPIEIRIYYEKLPENLKTIMFTMEKCKDELSGDQSYCEEREEFSFLLRINEDKTYYSAKIMAPYEAGIYPLILNVIDFQHQSLKELTSKLILRRQLIPLKYQKGAIWILVGRILVSIGCLILLVIIFYLIYKWSISKRRRLIYEERG